MAKVINLAVARKPAPVIVDVVQYATAPDIIFTIQDWQVPPGASANFYVNKPSGTKVYNGCTVDGNNIIMTPTTQTVAEGGDNPAQLEIVSGDKILFSFPMTLRVAECIVDDAAVESQDEFTALQEALDTVSQYDGRIADLENVTEGITHVPGSDTTQINGLVAQGANDKYWEVDETGQFKAGATFQGVYGVDSSGYKYPMILDNGTNLMIGATETNAKHHAGKTLISAGYDNTNSKGYDTVIVSVPNATNTGAINYNVWHSGNLPMSVDAGIQSISIGASNNTRNVYIWGNTTNKVGIGAYNVQDNARYNLGATADGIGLHNATDNSWVWRLTNISGQINVGGLTNFLAGDTFTASGGHYSGFVSTNLKEISFSIPIPRQANGRTVTVPKTAIIIRGLGGFIDNSGSDTTIGTTSAYTWTVLGQTNGIRITVAKSTTFTDATANTPIVVTFRTAPTFTFS